MYPNHFIIIAWYNNSGPKPEKNNGTRNNPNLPRGPPKLSTALYSSILKGEGGGVVNFLICTFRGCLAYLFD